VKKEKEKGKPVFKSQEEVDSSRISIFRVSLLRRTLFQLVS